MPKPKKKVHKHKYVIKDAPDKEVLQHKKEKEKELKEEKEKANKAKGPKYKPLPLLPNQIPIWKYKKNGEWAEYPSVVSRRIEEGYQDERTSVSIDYFHDLVFETMCKVRKDNRYLSEEVLRHIEICEGDSAKKTAFRPLISRKRVYEGLRPLLFVASDDNLEDWTTVHPEEGEASATTPTPPEKKQKTEPKEEKKDTKSKNDKKKPKDEDEDDEDDEDVDLDDLEDGDDDDEDEEGKGKKQVNDFGVDDDVENVVDRLAVRVGLPGGQCVATRQARKLQAALEGVCAIEDSDYYWLAFVVQVPENATHLSTEEAIRRSLLIADSIKSNFKIFPKKTTNVFVDPDAEEEDSEEITKKKEQATTLAISYFQKVFYFELESTEYFTLPRFIGGKVQHSNDIAGVYSIKMDTSGI